MGRHKIFGLSRLEYTLNSLKYFKFNSVFYKIFMATVFIVIILAILNYAGIKFITRVVLEKEITGNEVYLEYNCRLIDNLLKKIDESIISLVHDNDVATLRSVTPQVYEDSVNFRYYKEVANVAKKISLLKAVIAEISDFYIYFPKIDKVVNNEGLHEFNTFMSLRYEENPEKIKAEILKERSNQLIDIWNYKLKEERVNRLSRIYLTSLSYEGSGVNCIIVANLSRSFIENIYIDRFSADSGAKIFIVDNEENVISSNTGIPSGEKAGLGLLSSVDEEGEKYRYSIEKGNLMFYRKSAVNNIHYFIISPKESIFKDIKTINYYCNAFIIIFFTVGVILSFLISQKNYSPIKNILEDIETLSEISPMSSFGNSKLDEINFIKSNLTKIVTRNTNLENKVSNLMPHIIEIVLFKLITGKDEIKNAILLCSQNNIEFKDGFYCVAVMKMSGRNKMIIDNDGKNLEFYTKMVRKYLSEDVLSLFRVKENEYAIVLHYSHIDEEERILTGFREISDEVLNCCNGATLFIGVGQPQPDVTRISISYNQAQMAIKMRKVQDSGNILKYNLKHEIGNEKIYIPMHMEQKLFNSIILGNYDEALECVEETLQTNYANNIALGSYLKICASIQDMLTRIMNSCICVDDCPEKKNAELIENIGDEYDPHVVGERLKANIKNLCGYFIEKRRNDTFVSKILEYVDNEFCNNDMNLNLLAQKIDYNPSYLSKCFKQAVGISFTDYLGMKRIEKAKVLLLNSKKSVKEIACEVGYNSSNIFIRAFEKYIGISPGEYRKHNGLVDSSS